MAQVEIICINKMMFASDYETPTMYYVHQIIRQPII